MENDNNDAYRLASIESKEEEEGFFYGDEEEEDLFVKPRPYQSPMMRYRCCAALAAIFRVPSGAVRPLWCIIFRNVLLILVYYVLSIGLTFYQNHLLKEIKFPLSIVLCHLVIKFLLASFIRLTYELYTKQHRVLLDCNNWLKKLSLIGISGGLDIGFSNWGQEFITVSLYTMSKSTAIIFILGFALFLKLEEQHWSLIIIVGMISGGLFMFTYQSTQFELRGFLLIMAASFLSGLRWTMCQLIVQKSTLGLQNPIDMVYHVQPWMMIAVLPFAIFFEGPHISSRSMSFESMQEKAAFLYAMNAILLGALMAFFMEIAEYMVVAYTSSLTLSVAGIFKEICTLCLAVIFNGDQLSFINFLGLLMCFTGIIGHVAIKVMNSTRELEPTNHNTTSITTVSINASKNGPHSSNLPNVLRKEPTGGESGKPLLEVTSSAELESDVEIDDSWHR
ncbi:unnamed protein product [Orchesella dallaii]|uniref:Sugar phosphate transporter domain-containing protein n=1 Tax=Orchesella dallaii TaxID=48710 RepID=A0ABP1QVS7_9HEXA